jgi:hypothetical protein
VVAVVVISSWNITVAIAPGPVQGVGIDRTLIEAIETSLVVQLSPAPAQLVSETAQAVRVGVAVWVAVAVAVAVAVRVGVRVAVCARAA